MTISSFSSTSQRSAIGIFSVKKSPRLLYTTEERHWLPHITEEIYLDIPNVRVHNKFLYVQEVALHLPQCLSNPQYKLQE